MARTFTNPSVVLADGRRVAVEYEAEGGISGCTSGPPEVCFPDEPPEITVLTVWLGEEGGPELTLTDDECWALEELLLQTHKDDDDGYDDFWG